MSKEYFLSKTEGGMWDVLYGTKEKYEWVNDYRAKSRSRFEMQHLLDHVNKQLPNWDTCSLHNSRERKQHEHSSTR